MTGNDNMYDTSYPHSFQGVNALIVNGEHTNTEAQTR